MEEYLENNAPLIVNEIHRWKEIIGHYYLRYKYEIDKAKNLLRDTSIA
jgi:hypothetical protein